MPEGRDDLVDGVLGSHDGDQILLEKLVLTCWPRDGALLASAKTRELQFSRDRLGDVADHGAVGAFDADGAVDQGRGLVLVAAAVAQRQEAEEQHADDAVEVGDRIAHGGDRSAVGVFGECGRVARCCQGGSIGDRAGVGAGDHRGAHPQSASDAEAGECRDDEHHEHQGQRPYSITDDMEEVGAGLNANCEGENRQTQRSQRCWHFDDNAFGDARRSQGDACE